MRWLVAVLLAVHGLIHLIAFAKAFGYAKLAQLTPPISREMGLLWLAAALLIVASAVMIVVRPRSSWIVGAVALVMSQAVILSAWRDAWAGTFVNVVLLLAVAHGWFTEGPRARMTALPVEAFHRLIGGHATMQVKIAGAIPMVDARGDVMDRSEAVTLFNDMCLLAPGTLLDPSIGWEQVDVHMVRARFSDGGHSTSRMWRTTCGDTAPLFALPIIRGALCVTEC